MLDFLVLENHALAMTQSVSHLWHPVLHANGFVFGLDGQAWSSIDGTRNDAYAGTSSNYRHLINASGR